MTAPRKPGRPHSGNVKLTVHIKPETRAWLGEKPGKRIDEIVSAAIAATKPEAVKGGEG
jgi:hypothetical protein